MKLGMERGLGGFALIRENLPNPRHPRSISTG
jgi:hypothetical protein